MQKNLQPTLFKTFARIGYKPVLKFYDQMYRAGHAVQGYPHWETDRLSITMRDPEHRCSLLMNNRSLQYEQDSSNLAQEQEQISSTFTTLLEHLEPETYLELFHHHTYLVSVPGSFEPLAQLMRIKMIENEELEACFPGNYVDFSYDYLSQDNLLLYDIQIGPTWGQQADQLIPFNKSSHLNPQAPERDYVEARQGLPEISIYISIKTSRQAEDPYRENKTPYRRLHSIEHQEIFPFFDKARIQAQKTAKEILSYLFKQKVS